MTNPRATYRLQLNAQFTFAHATAVVPYLAELGISHLYLSPILQAAEGSTHGYDVVDPDRVNEALGGEAGFRELVAAARSAGLQILLDIVPNHMSIAGAKNRWWIDVLENGPASFFAHFFDVDWGVASDERVLLPVLGERYGRALTSGTITIQKRDCRFHIRAHDHIFPMSPRSLGPVVRRAADRAQHTELQFIGDALAALPSSRDVQPMARARRHRDKGVLLDRVQALCDSDPHVREAIDAEIAAINADPVELDAILEAQNYRLAFWQVAGSSQLRHRRFFDITTLVGLRNEDPDVFQASHGRVLQWIADGTIAGVRIDHVDGLRAPGAYLKRLRAAAPNAWIVVEKILATHEQLPPWPIDGTTGYDFAERIAALFVDPDGERRLTAAFSSYTGDAFDPASESRKARHEVMSDALHSELERVTDFAVRACAESPACRDYTRAEIQTALAEILAGYSVYRTYLGEDLLRHEDRTRIAAAAQLALVARPDLDKDLVGFLESAIAFELPGAEVQDLASAIQQVTGALVAKGDEDTLLYRQVRLLARCEVGADLGVFAIEPDDLHAELAAGRGRSLLATSTHDTKRAEDVRARIAVLSEVAREWSEAAQVWRQRAEPAWGDLAPDRTFEYALWQTMIGSWPLSVERAKAWAQKSTREARLRTSWRQQDAAYEAARDRFVDRIFSDRTIVTEIERFAERVRPHGDRNSLAQLLVKLAAPGVPDIYQGAELRDDSLVDPDNRRPVDFDLRRQRMREVVDARASDVRARLEDGDLGIAKLFTIRRALGLRRRAPHLFAGAYAPLAARGSHAERVFAFERRAPHDAGALVACVPRLGVNADGWRDTVLPLPSGTWRDALSDRDHAGDVALVELWRDFPIALLVRA